MAHEAGTEIGGYEVERALAAGAMADVYVVNKDGKRFALKMLTYNDEGMKERMLQEGRILSQLQHPNIVGVQEVVRHAGQPGLVLEYVEGGFTLEDLLGRKLTLKQIDAIARGIMAGVAAAHDKGIVHRDLKPGNVLIARSGSSFVPKVADFGLAKPSDGGAGATRTGTSMGTPKYMPPEQLRDAKHVDHRADIWSVAAMLYELVCEKPVIEGSTMIDAAMVLSGPGPKPARELKPDLPPRILDALDRALVLDPKKRIGSCAELLEVWSGGEALDTGVWMGFAAPEGGPKAGEKTVWEAPPTRVPTVPPKVAAPAPPPEPAASSKAPLVAVGVVLFGVLALALVVAAVAVGVAAAMFVG